LCYDPRGLFLPDIRDQALRQLRELGWHVDDGAHSTFPKRRSAWIFASAR